MYVKDQIISLKAASCVCRKKKGGWAFAAEFVPSVIFHKPIFPLLLFLLVESEALLMLMIIIFTLLVHTG